MAIIYTYPIVTPELRDLVVITDASDKNFTKQASVQAIIDLFDCSKCSFCTTSISKINTPSGGPIEALHCDSEINFTSSDGSVTIAGDAVSNTIDLKAVGGGGGCPTTYVIKPVSCDEGTGDCIIGKKPADWIYTCDTTLGALAPGYINNFKITGENAYWPYGPGDESNCFWIEEVSYTAVGVECEDCCSPPPDLVYTFTPCDRPGGEDVTFSTAVGNITGLSPAYVDNPCYFLTIDGDFPPIQHQECWLVTLGGVDSGEVVEILSADLLTGDDCTCECCLWPCTFEYTACPDAPKGAPAKIQVDGGLFEPNCDITGAPDNVTHEYAAGLYWCYSDPVKVCVKPTASWEASGFIDDCNHPDYCPTTTYTFQNCTDGSVVVLADDPGLSIGETYRYCCDDGSGTGEVIEACYEYMGPGVLPVSGSFPCGGIDPYLETTCDCCLYPCNYIYEACPDGKPEEAPATIIINTGKSGEDGCTCNEPNPTIYIEYDEDGNTWCYTNPIRECTAATHIELGGVECGDADYCPTPPDVTKRWKSCADEDWIYEDDADPITGTFATPGNYYVGQLNTEGECVVQGCCIQVESTLESGPTQGWSVWIGSTGCNSAYDTSWEDCDCCRFADVVTYDLCDPDCNVGGDVNIPNFNLDVCAWGTAIGEPAATPGWKPATAPDYIQLGGCCYQKGDVPCSKETFISSLEFAYGDLSWDETWFDCSCEEPQYYTWQQCGDGELNYTTEDVETLYPGLFALLPFTGPLADQGTAAGCWDGTCCLSVEGPFPGTPPSDDPIPCFPATAGDTQDCDCCIYYDIVTYSACLPDECEIEGYQDVNIDVCEWSEFLGITPPWWKPNTAPEYIQIDTGGGNKCCYKKQLTPPCAEETLISGAGLGYGDLTYDLSWEDCNCGEEPLVEKWIYPPCGDCDELVSTDQIHPDGATVMWWDCCWYEVPGSTTPTALPDSDVLPTSAEVYTLDSPFDCETIAPQTHLEWVNCTEGGTDPASIVTPCDCPGLPSPISIGTTLTGFSINGNPPVTDCYQLSAIVTPEADEVDCTTDPCECE